MTQCSFKWNLVGEMVYLVQSIISTYGIPLYTHRVYLYLYHVDSGLYINVSLGKFALCINATTISYGCTFLKAKSVDVHKNCSLVVRLTVHFSYFSSRMRKTSYINIKYEAMQCQNYIWMDFLSIEKHSIFSKNKRLTFVTVNKV